MKPHRAARDETRAESPLTLAFAHIHADDLPLVGGKAANLGAMTRAGIPVPSGFCVTSVGYAQFIEALPEPERFFSALDALDPAADNLLDAVRAAAEAMRAALALLPMPAAVERAVIAAWESLGPEESLAVRSSATAEDLPGASFAGQQDTYLNVRGREALLDAIKRCWISLFTDRAVLYRAKNGFGHRGVSLCVVVQLLIEPEVSGIMFTADPVSGHRAMLWIDAGFGLGEAMVGGLISADLYKYDRRARRVLLARPGDKAFAIRSAPDGGTQRVALDAPERSARCLSDEQVRALAVIAERVEEHYRGAPQDIEWCIRRGVIHVLQARPITALFPVPGERRREGEALRAYVSFGHIQMMLDPMPTLAREVWQYFLPAAKDGAFTVDSPARRSRVVVTAGERLFIDVTDVLAVPALRRVMLAVIGHVYEDIGRSLAELAKRESFREDPWAVFELGPAALALMGPVIARVPWLWLTGDPARHADDAARGFEDVQRAMRERISNARTESERVARAALEVHGVFASVRPFLSRVLAGVLAHRALTALARGAWAEGSREQVTSLLRGLPANVTTEMDLAVGDLSDRARELPAVAAILKDGAVEPWPSLRARIECCDGGPVFLQALDGFIARYGARGVGEIDLSRPRWRDDPSVLVRVITGGLDKSAPGAHRRRHAAQVAEGEAAVDALSLAARRGALGAMRAWLVRRLALTARTGMGLREHPKFMLVRVLGLMREEALRAGEILAKRGQIPNVGAVFHLGFDELAAALDDPSRDLRSTVARREAAFALARDRRPPVVLSSDGETPTLEVDRSQLPPGALPGTAASAGVVEGVARVVRDPEREVLESGEILVASFTDPGWTPLFVHAAGVVTEVGGLMTHGAVVAREYGIPAVVSVAGALDRIRTGQRIRVDGTRGFVEILDAP